MFRFAHPEHLPWLLLLIPLAALMILLARMRLRRIRAFGVPETVLRLIDGNSRYKFLVKHALFLAACGLFLLAWARPQLGTKFEEVKRQGVDLIVALDVSYSMKAEDIKPSRLESAKRELSELIDQLKGDRVGIILFAGDAYTQLPLTTDYHAALLLTDIIDCDMVPKPGTAIGSAIDLARNSFTKGEGKYKAMIIITDGENHEDDAVAAAKHAAKENIIIHTIGMGSPGGAPIPVRENGVQTGYRTDREGNVILTRLDEKGLEEIAAATGGTYIRATNTRNDLAAVFGEIERMEKKEFGSKQFTDYEDRFQIPVAAGLLLLLLELLLSEKRNRAMARFALFNTQQPEG